MGKKSILHILVLLLPSIMSYGQSIDNLEYYIQNKKIGLRNIITSKLIVPCKYDYVGDFVNGIAPIKRNELWGFINETGKEVISPKFEEAKQFGTSVELAPVMKGGKWGFINKLGRIIIPIKYDYAYPFNQSYTTVRKGDKWGVIDSNDNIILDFVYDNPIITRYDNGYFECRKNGRVGIMSFHGEILLPLEYEGWLGSPSEGLFTITQENKVGFADFKGNIIIPTKYSHCGEFKNDVAAVSDENGSYLINCKGEKIWSILEKNTNLFRALRCDENLFVLTKHEGGSSAALINQQGAYVVPFNYKTINILYGQGLFAVKDKDNKWGFIDSHGAEIIPCSYDDVETGFWNFACAVMKNGKWGTIDKDNVVVTSFKYDLIDYLYFGYKAKLSDKWAIIDNYGKVVSEPIYDDIIEMNKQLRYAKVKKGNLQGFVDFYGNDTF